MENTVIKAIKERRSCRGFKSQQIKDEDLQAILEAGKYAANGRGMQSTKMIVIQNPEVIAKLSKWNADILGVNSDPFYGAPTVIVVLADANRPTAVEDGSLVMGNLMLAAHSVGLASCWIHRAKEEFASEKGKNLLKQWGIQGDYIGIAHCVIGYPTKELPKAAPRKSDFIVTVK